VLDAAQIRRRSLELCARVERLRLGARDLRRRARDGGFLRAFRLLQVGEVRFLQPEVALGLLELVAIVPIVQAHEHLSRGDLLEVLDRDLRDVAVDLGRDDRHVAADVRVVGRFGRAGEWRQPPGMEREQERADDGDERDAGGNELGAWDGDHGRAPSGTAGSAPARSRHQCAPQYTASHTNVTAATKATRRNRSP
jgi:hypothetical protein